MRDWFDIYRERMNAEYLDHVARKYAPFIAELHERRGEIQTEIGCGAGNITRLVREMETKRRRWYHLTDSCPKMLGLAIENNPVINCNFSCADARTAIPANSDLIHSHGLLEHFDNANIRHIVSNMSKAAPTQIHYVPSAAYITPSRGDERLLEPGEWKEILRGLGRVSISQFNDGLDLILRIER